VDGLLDSRLTPIQLVLTRSPSTGKWSASIVDQQGTIWASPQVFDSADQAYYRGIGELVLREGDNVAKRPSTRHPSRSDPTARVLG
jgi:hypothetical protein